MPVDVVGLGGNVQAISAGGHHTCALTTGGGVKCWGNNDWGQIGDGSGAHRLTPVNVIGLGSGVQAITAGHARTCALTTGGGAKCWGNNVSGQLGDGSRTTRFTAVSVVDMSSGVQAITNLYVHTCALTVGGGVKCWGGNPYGQIGDGGSTTTPRLTPVDVVSLSSGAQGIAAGGSHTCALTTGGGAKCWGGNYSGQLGDGSTTTRPTPADVLEPFVPAQLEVSITPLDGAFARGSAETRQYRISVLNVGNATAQDVSLSVPAPAGLTSVAWTCGAPGDCAPTAGENVVTTVFGLPPGESAHVDLIGQVLSGVAFVDITAHASTASGGGAQTQGSLSEGANGIGLMKNGFEQ